MILKYSI